MRLIKFYAFSQTSMYFVYMGRHEMIDVKVQRNYTTYNVYL